MKFTASVLLVATAASAANGMIMKRGRYSKPFYLQIEPQEHVSSNALSNQFAQPIRSNSRSAHLFGAEENAGGYWKLDSTKTSLPNRLRWYATQDDDEQVTRFARFPLETKRVPGQSTEPFYMANSSPAHWTEAVTNVGINGYLTIPDAEDGIFYYCLNTHASEIDPKQEVQKLFSVIHRLIPGKRLTNPNCQSIKLKVVAADIPEEEDE